MKIEKLLAGNIFDVVMECHYAFINNISKTSGIHYHDFYELFLIMKGSTKHIVNEEVDILEEGTLVFVRPRDIHYYEKVSDTDCQIINLAFSSNTFKDMCSFLGKGFSGESIEDIKFPPKVLLSVIEKNIIKNSIENIYFSNSMDVYLKKTLIRAMLVEIFVKYFIKTKNEDNSVPGWLLDLKKQMEFKNNFVQGVSAMRNISGKSTEHINRMFVKYFKVTPTNFINKLRINYAANLLIHTNEDIVDIALEAGFQNLSHFYHLFKKINKVSPGEYRNLNKRKIIP